MSTEKKVTVYVNIYADHTTGWGYKSPETAEKYARMDKPVPVIATAVEVELDIPTHTHK